MKLIKTAITTRLVDTVTTPMLLKMVNSGKIDASSLITHSKSTTSQDFAKFVLLMQPVEMAFKDMEQAYETFGAAAKHKALKILVSM